MANAALPCLAHLPPDERVAQQAQSIDQCIYVARFYQQAVDPVPDKFRGSANVCTDHGSGEGHGIHKRSGKPFHMGREKNDV
jgi:hypothetical protein